MTRHDTAAGWRTTAGAWLTLVLLVVLAACGGGSDTVAPANDIEIGPADPEVALAETLQLTATVRDDQGHPVAGAQVFWSSSAPEIATVSQSGVVTPKQIGQVDIAASAEGRSGVTRVRVVRKRAARVTLVPSTSSLTVGDTVAMQVVVEAVDGERLTDRTVTFASTAPTVADVVMGPPRAIARGPGSARIVARVEEVADTSNLTVAEADVASLEVSPSAPTLVVGETVVLRVTALDAKGRALTGRTVSFSSGNTSVATVDGNGTVTARSAGDAAITVSSGGVQERVTVRVSPVPLSQVTLSPSTFSLRVGESRTITATVRNSRGEVVTGRTIAWTSSAPAIATVDQSGRVTGILPGPAVITAKVDGLEASAGVTVSLVPVRSVTVAPTSASMLVGDRQAFTVTAVDEAGQPVTGRAVTWRSSNTGVAAVSSTGEVIALAAGSSTITATIDGVEGTASVTVATQPVGSVTVSPTSASLTVGGTRQLSVTVRDATGGVITGKQVTWSSSDTDVATVSSSGLVTAVGAGQASIAATVDGVVGTAAITVAAAGIRDVSVTPSTAQVTKGETRQLSVTVTDANGQTVANPSVTWRSSDEGVATVSSSGLVTARTPGTATITAASGGVEGTASVTVVPPGVSNVVVSPGSLELDPNETRQFTVTATDVNGQVVSNPQVGWSSSNQSVATVSSSGVVTAKAAGTTTIRATVGGVDGTAQVKVNAPTPTAGPPAAIRVVTGGTQTGRRNQTLGAPVVVEVVDSKGVPVPGVRVRWEANMGGSFSPQETTTGTDGRTSSQWRLGNPLGTQNGRAYVVSNDNVEVRFTALVIP